MIRIYTQIDVGEEWLRNNRHCSPVFACVLGFTETGLIPGISAAGSTPEDRKYTACADAEFLYYGAKPGLQYPLPPLIAGASPVFITRAVVEALKIPVYLFNAGLPQLPAVPTIDLGGAPARCLSQGEAMELATVNHLLEQGLLWGERLGNNIQNGYFLLGECVVGGTTTALAILTGLGIKAAGKVNSSHPVCNHTNKWSVVQAGLLKMTQRVGEIDPLQLVAAVGDPMQVVVAGMTIALSRHCGVMLAGGTQMLAVYALTSAIAKGYDLPWQPQSVVIGTTRWVAEDPTGGTIELAQLIGEYCVSLTGVPPSLLATSLSFANSHYSQLRVYEQGFVKEGVGAGGICIAAHLYKDWQQNQLLAAVENQLERYQQIYNT
ncbi:nicotinate mononucleotide-dependent phosphoribosyltransferase CobT [Iningainema tapete]|uniref:UPF0284 protein ICL16_29080 n=1 Tax=Iningainema tapete BLCC-T55 TaxID=2748662 RepID=A0A8J6XK03_9CYAN|nr:TIGR00303 family protein [Iningainema tapete]MBD2776003.1 TIGR00303 family protein [Iningainema tapete BLCC-T55]